MPNRLSSAHRLAQAGFTLIELIIGMVVLGIALTTITTLIYPQAQNSVDPLFQVRGTELANGLLNEIQGKAFDENSYSGDPLLRCDEDSIDGDSDIDVECSLILGMDTGEYTGAPGSEVALNDLFDDVDDYHGFSATGEQLAGDTNYASRYKNYLLAVTVFYDGNYDGVDDGTDLVHRGAKLIQLTVTLPNNDEMLFAVYRSNF